MNEEAAGARYENLFSSQIYYDQQHEQGPPPEGGAEVGSGYVKQGTSHEQRGYVKQGPPHEQPLQIQQRDRIKTPADSNGAGANLEHSLDSAGNNINSGHDRSLIGGKRWNPSQTRVFDVFLSDNSRVRQPDIFAYDANKLGFEDRQSTKSDGDDEDEEEEESSQQELDSRGLTLINTGQGRRVRLPAAGVGFVSKRSASTKGRNLSLPIHPGMQRIDMMLSRGTPPSTAKESKIEGRLSVSAGTDNSDPLRLRSNSLPTPLSTANQGDKWPPQVETAFLSALKVIMKNGTSKIKLREKNYGRNELISLFIKHRCGEVRTKKQISSHIQVWKKSILNKVSNNIEINDFEKELLNLIEHGAAQTNESWRLFEETFNDILDAEESNTDGSISSERSTPNGNSGILIHSPCLGGTNGFPHSTLVGSLDYKKEPTTPLEYAQEIYSHLKSYKCVPVNVERQLYTPSSATSNPPVSATSAPGEDSHKRIIEAAKEVETQQRRLIEELLQQQQPNNFKQRPPIKAPTTSSGIYSPTHIEQQAHAPYSAPYSSAGRPVHRYYGVSPQQQRLSYPMLQQPSYSTWVPRVAQTAPGYSQVPLQGQAQGHPQGQVQGQIQGQIQGQVQGQVQGQGLGQAQGQVQVQGQDQVQGRLQQPVQQSPLQSQIAFHQQTIHQHAQAPPLHYQFRQPDQQSEDTQMQYQHQHQVSNATEAQMQAQVHGQLHAQALERPHEHSLAKTQQHQPQRQLKLKALPQVAQSSEQPLQQIAPQVHGQEHTEVISPAEARRQSAAHAQVHVHDKALTQTQTQSQAQAQSQSQQSSQQNLPLALQSSLKPNQHANHAAQSLLPSSHYSSSVQLQESKQKETDSANVDLHGAPSLKSEQ